MPDAALDVVFEDEKSDGVYRCPQSRRLLEDVDAVFPALNHALDATDLARDAAQPPNEDRLGRANTSGERSSRVPDSPPSHALPRQYGSRSRPCSIRGYRPELPTRPHSGHHPGAYPKLSTLSANPDDTPGEYDGQRLAGVLKASRSGPRVEATPCRAVRGLVRANERIDLEGGSARAVEHEPGGMTDEELTRSQACLAPDPLPSYGFAHASEAEFARILDFYQVVWEYEPQVFPILWDLDGNVLESFAPDFFLPDLELFVELTTLQQRLVRKKNRKVRRLRELYPGLRIKLFYARDFRALMLKYGRSALLSGLSGTLGQVVPHQEQSDVDDSMAWSAGPAGSATPTIAGVESSAGGASDPPPSLPDAAHAPPVGARARRAKAAGRSSSSPRDLRGVR